MKFKRSPIQADLEYKTETDEDTSAQALAAMARSPTKGTRRLSAQIGIRKSSAMLNLRAKALFRQRVAWQTSSRSRFVFVDCGRWNYELSRRYYDA
ncbi:hypothetical protein AVEN_164119-1 [Araneus ventricosus]|uniref:Uncharacterized protein n=1 Tax=Araneus ventricosus TaxID=182803 RepID=A0A4Y2UN75_ARAVE|nr:hypothetical protein AVEN_8211-1 [Araneus ventricosus]GBO13596.1 hypothetical protein AVEN_164119-1 [Araneus ventricosus]